MVKYRFLTTGGIVSCLFSYASFSAALPPKQNEEQVDLKINGQSQQLTDWEREYLLHATERLYSSCELAQTEPKLTHNLNWSNELSIISMDGSERAFHLKQNKVSQEKLLTVYEVRGDSVRRLSQCNGALLLPVAGIIESRILSNKSTLGELTSAVDFKFLYHQTNNRSTNLMQISQGKLTSYEPNRVGWTVENNGVEYGYLDALISFKYDFWESVGDSNPTLFFGFTTQFSQYIESINSSPVVARRYNPSLFSRWYLSDSDGYIDAGYAHESNGQSINTEESYQAEREKYARSDNDASFARNYISRGWDYILLNWEQCWMNCPAEGFSISSDQFFTQVGLKYFLDDGLFQGNPEEYNVWELDGVHHRKQYDGISFRGEYKMKDDCLWNGYFCEPQLAWLYTTGYDDITKNNTNRIEFTIRDLWFIPAVMVWAQRGYNSNLVDYYKDIDSVGAAVIFETAY